MNKEVISKKENHLDVLIADCICRFLFDNTRLFHLFKKEFPPVSRVKVQPTILIRIVNEDKDDPLRYRILKDKGKKESIYCFPSNTASLTRNIKFGMSVLLQYLLLEKNVLLMHASSSVHNGRGFLFPGPSGTGKSTMISNFRKKDVLSDDIAIIKKIKNEYYLYNSPFDYGKYENKNQRMIKLTNIFFLEKSGYNKMHPFGPLETLDRMFHNTILVYFENLVNSSLRKDKNPLLKKITANNRTEKNYWDTIFKQIYQQLFAIILSVPSQRVLFTKKVNIDELFV